MFKLLHNMYFALTLLTLSCYSWRLFRNLLKKVKVVWDIRGIKKEVKAGLGIDHCFSMESIVFCD